MAKLERLYLFTFIVLAAIVINTSSFAERLKDISSIAGVRDNQLIGYGLVIGLEGTGDGGTNTYYVIQSITTMMAKLGITIPPSQVDQIKAKNIAAVIVTAVLPPFARAGSKIDVLISSIGDAKSLQGGNLLFSPLKGADGNIYAVAQGPISIGGVQTGSLEKNEQRNHLTVGKIMSGAIIEREIPFDFSSEKDLTLILNKPDFTTASRVSHNINVSFNRIIAHAQDGGTVKIEIPEIYHERQVEFVTRIESISVTPDTKAKVVIEERTGTVVIGENVRISPIAISHGPLNIVVKKRSKEPGLAAVRRIRGLGGNANKGQVMVIKDSVNIKALVKALNTIGARPQDLIVIFQTIKAAGALHAELEII